MKDRRGGNYTHIRYMSTFEKNTPEYKLWRLAVYKRDKFMCKKCGRKLTKGRHLQAHHIYKWSDYPSMRYDINNGITLCWECHKLLFGNENSYILMCKQLLLGSETLIKVQKLIREAKEEEEQQNKK